MTPFYHGHFGYSTHVKSTQKHVGRYNSKNTNSHPSKPSNPPRRILETPDPRTPVRPHTQTQRGPHKRCQLTRPAGDHFRKHILEMRWNFFQELQMSPKKRGHFNKKKDRDLPIPIPPRDMLVSG